MKRSSVCLSLLAVAVLVFTLAPDLSAAKAPEATGPEPSMSLSPTVEPSSPVYATPAPAPASCESQTEAASGLCYPWQPSCTRDKQCDKYCGTPGWGVCSRFCCYCLG